MSCKKIRQNKKVPDLKPTGCPPSGFSLPRPKLELDVAAVKLQKVYKSYRTRRNLADCAVVVEELWWKALDFASLNGKSVTFFEKPETAVSRWARARSKAAKVGKGLSKDEKARKLALQHWLEAIDPRHRYGHNLHFNYDIWFDSASIQPFFYWLDLGDGRELNLEKCSRTKLQHQIIKYLGPESFDVDLHVPHVRRAVNRFMGQRLKDFRSKLYRHYKGIAQGLDKRAFPHEDVQQEDWIDMCDWFETDEFQKMSEKNTESRKKQKDYHCCGSKPFVRIREELKDQETQEEPGRVSMYHHTRFSKKKDRWVSSAAEHNYNMMNALQLAPTPPNSTPLTEDQVYDKVIGKRSGYVNGLGHGQDPLPTSALDELDIVEEARRHAERRAEEAERCAKEAQRRLEESERRLEESERRTNERLQAMQEQMLNFMEQYQPPSVMDLLMGGMRGTSGMGSGMGSTRGS